MRALVLLLALSRVAAAAEGEVRADASLLALIERDSPAPLPSVIDASSRSAVISLRACFHASRTGIGLCRKTRGRTTSSKSAKNSSTTACVLAPGVYTTRTPRALQAARSIVSSPTPARATTRSFLAASTS